MFGISYSGVLISPQKQIKNRKYTQPVMENSGMKWQGMVFHKKHTDKCQLMRLGDSRDCDCDGVEDHSHNTVLTVGIHSIINKLVDKDNINNNDGFITHIELGGSKSIASAGQTSTVIPRFRKALTSAERDGTNAIFKVFLNPTDANSVSGTVAIGQTTTQMDLLAGNGSLFEVGETVSIDGEFVEITNIVGDAITVSPALSTTPSGGETISSTISEIVLYGGGSATDVTGTGIAFARSSTFTPKVKVPGSGETLEWHVNIS